MVNTNLTLADLKTYALEHHTLCLCDLCQEVYLQIEEAVNRIAATSKAANNIAEEPPPLSFSYAESSAPGVTRTSSSMYAHACASGYGCASLKATFKQFMEYYKLERERCTK